MTPATIAALEAAKRDGRPIVLATRLPDGEQRLLPDPGKPAELNEAADHALREDASGTVKVADSDWFLHVYNPPLRLVVVGRCISRRRWCRCRRNAGFAVTVVDPRRSFASDERFPDVTSPPPGRTRRWTRCAGRAHRRGDADARPEAR